MYYYEVLPLTRTGAKDTTFTYESNDNIKLGKIVKIPLRNREVKGLIVKKVKKPEFDTKPISKILTDEAPLSEVQIKLALKIADYYLCNISDVIPNMLPFEFGKRRRTIPEEKQTKTRNHLKLTDNQEKIFKDINKSKTNTTHLIFGVTGSGKTEIYLQLIDDAIKSKKSSIMLVPEISLTPQTVKRFEERFGNKVAVWHSHLKETEKYHTWNKIKSGEKMVVVGARSAIFAPIKNLAYIIIDESHESSYKQDQKPRYETIRVAEWLVKITNAKLVLGTATPKVESYAKAKAGKYILHELKERIVQNKMPQTEIIDMGNEFKKKNYSIFSEILRDSIIETLKSGKQVLLFVNRRGASTFVVCRDCGYAAECPNCDIPLVYHPSQGNILKCHHCGYAKKSPSKCPKCASVAIKFFGLGTQRVEIEAKKWFPKARIGRMDKDTTSRHGEHEKIYNDFAKGKYDILIGTQLIAKGWDLPNVSLVGVISADNILNMPDFRSAERTFSLLTQVAGRTGRGYHPGNVYIQTYTPENYAIRAASKHSYLEFYNREIKERKKYNYPPFSNLVKLTISGKDKEKTEDKAKKLSNNLSEKIDNNSTIFGPTTAFIPRLSGKYRFQIIIKTKNLPKIQEVLRDIDLKDWTYDINPESLL